MEFFFPLVTRSLLSYLPHAYSIHPLTVPTPTCGWLRKDGMEVFMFCSPPYHYTYTSRPPWSTVSYPLVVASEFPS